MKVSELFGIILTESKAQTWHFVEMTESGSRNFTNNPDINAEVNKILIGINGDIYVYYCVSEVVKNTKKTVVENGLSVDRTKEDVYYEGEDNSSEKPKKMGLLKRIWYAGYDEKEADKYKSGESLFGSKEGAASYETGMKAGLLMDQFKKL